MATVKTNAGRAILSNLVSGIGGTIPQYVGIGSGSTAAAATDTTLTTEYTTGTWTGYARVAATISRITTSVTNDTVKWIAAFTAPSAETVAEAGNFDTLTVGGLYIHGVFTGIPLSTGDSLTLTITEQYT